MNDALRIKSISIQGFKAIREFSLTPDGKSLTLKGRNGAGKSSVHEAIWVALTQKEVPGVAVHRETVKARIELGLSNDFVVTWSCTAGGTKSLKIEDAEGRPFPKPAEFLRNLIGNISFDPFEFAEKTPGDQKKQLEGILALDFSDIEADKRKHLDRKAAGETAKKTAEAELAKLASVTETAPVDTTTLMAQQEALNELVARRNQYAGRMTELDSKVVAAAEVLEGYTREMEQLKQRALQIKNELVPAVNAEIEAIKVSIGKGADALKAVDESIAEFPDVSSALRNSGETNRRAQDWTRKKEYLAAHKAAEQQIEAASMEVAALEQKRIQRLADAKFPVEGLEFSETGLLFRGLPFDEKNQCKSDIIKIGCAIAISQNPGLKICRIKDGSLLDKQSKADILGLLHEHGFQVLIEEVDPEGGDLFAELVELPE